MKKLLFTFVGSRDPYDDAPIEGQQLNGPILTLAKHMPFDRIVLFATPTFSAKAAQTKARLQENHPSCKVQIDEISLEDPTSHLEILRALRNRAVKIAVKSKNHGVYIAVASGTPQMHACWLLLAASGEIPAHILQLRHPRYVTSALPLISDVDLSHPEVPKFIPNVLSNVEVTNEVPKFQEALNDIGIIGDHPLLLKAIEDSARVAPSNTSVLILGESGTGKELMAKLIHTLSRRTGSFEPVNCANVQESLFESDLFGHKKGAATGIVEDRLGLFAKANKGTIFLDEIGEMPLPLQAKLLRVLETGKVRPVGSDVEIAVDVRVISATNTEVATAIREKRFRGDLYYRLNGFEISLPSLRERWSDIPKLAQHFVLSNNTARSKKLSHAAMKLLQDHPWPGNIRELKRVIETAAILADGNTIEAKDIRFGKGSLSNDGEALFPEPREGFSMNAYIKELRSHLKRRACELAGGNQSKAAKLLGIKPQAINKSRKEKQKRTK